jgi:hypothetical protein
MPRGATIPPGLPSPRGGAARRRHRMLPGNFTLGLLFAGLMTGLLALAGAALLEHRVIGTGAAAGEELSLSCAEFQVGSPHAAATHLSLKNAGPASTSVRLDVVGHTGVSSQAIGYSPILPPWGSGDFVFRTPALGATITLTSSGRDLQASAEILRDDGAPPEIRQAIGCLARSAPLPE